MKFLYRQDDSASIFPDFGIRACCFKHISASDAYSKKLHHHTYFEVHIVLSGCQSYIIDEKEYAIKKGHFLIIPPFLKHKTSHSGNELDKLALNFYLDAPCGSIPLGGVLPPQAFVFIDEIFSEAPLSTMLSERLTENSVFYLTAIFMRRLGIKETAARKCEPSANIILSLAKQYINDNIRRAPSVDEVAAHCHISSKQLTRIFTSSGVSPAVYIRKKRLALCEELLRETSYTLCEISEKMNFSSEYYFNTFFKKCAGMTPGEYRRANRRDA